MKKATKVLMAGVIAIAMISLQSCEGCKRQMKTYKSDISGLQRKAVLYDYQGNVIKQWSGKFDIHDDGADRIFFDLDGKRVWIRGGIFIAEEQ